MLQASLNLPHNRQSNMCRSRRFGSRLIPDGAIVENGNLAERAKLATAPSEPRNLKISPLTCFRQSWAWPLPRYGRGSNSSADLLLAAKSLCAQSSALVCELARRLGGRRAFEKLSPVFHAKFLGNSPPMNKPRPNPANRFRPLCGINHSRNREIRRPTPRRAWYDADAFRPEDKQVRPTWCCPQRLRGRRPPDVHVDRHSASMFA